jgi:protein-S-isoprenylcysteine O-methyltransferase Ste14
VRGSLPGRAFVAFQVVLIAALLVAPRWWDASWEPGRLGPWLGWSLILAGAALAVAAAVALGRNLTPFPEPKPSAALVTTGPYRYARHPIYGGVLLAAAGWTLASGSLAVGVLTLAALAFFDAKRRFEERALRRRFDGYDRYREATRVFLPFLF